MQNRWIGVILAATLASSAWGQPATRPAMVAGHPNLNGVWQAITTANWNLEAHSAEALDQFWSMGAIAAIPAGKSMLKGGGTIPYLPKALEQRNKNRAAWPEADPEAKCYMLGVPRSIYFGMPFQLFQGNGDYAISQPFAATNRVIHMKPIEDLPVESWMGQSIGKWIGTTLEVVTKDQNDKTWFDRAGNFHSDDLLVTERFTPMDKDHIRYEATMTDPVVFSRPWTIELVLYRLVEDNAQIQEHKCVAFADKLLYSDLMRLAPQPKKPTSK